MSKIKFKYYHFYYLIFFMSLGIYAQALFFEFAGDDKIFITENRNVDKGFEGIKNVWTNSSFYGWNNNESSSYRPFTLSIFTITASIFDKDNSIIFHSINVILYFALCSLIFKLLFQTLKIQLVPSIIITTLFLVNGTHSEVVANIKSMDIILSFIFGILAIISVINLKMIYTLIFLIFSIFSNETGVVFIFICIINILFSEQKVKLQYYVILVFPLLLYTIIRYSIIPETFDVGFNSQANPLIGIENSFNYFGNAFYLQLIHIKSIFYQSDFVFYYSLNHFELSNMTAFLGWIFAALSIIGTILIIRSRNKAKILLIFLYWFPTLFLGSFLFPNGTIYADRFVFIPSLSIIALLVIYIYELLKKYNYLKYGASFCVIFMLFSVYATYKETKDWKNDTTLIDDLIENSNNSSRAYLFKAFKETNLQMRLKIVNEYNGPIDVLIELLKCEIYVEFQDHKKLIETTNRIFSLDYDDFRFNPTNKIYFYTALANVAINVKNANYQMIKDCIDIFPFSDSYYVAGLYYDKLNDKEKAKYYYEKGIEIDNFKYDIIKHNFYYTYAINRFSSNDKITGLFYMEKSLTVRKSFSAYYGLAKYYYLENDFYKSSEYIELAFNSIENYKFQIEESELNEAKQMKSDLEKLLIKK